MQIPGKKQSKEEGPILREPQSQMFTSVGGLETEDSECVAASFARNGNVSVKGRWESNEKVYEYRPAFQLP